MLEAHSPKVSRSWQPIPGDQAMHVTVAGQTRSLFCLLPARACCKGITEMQRWRGEAKDTKGKRSVLAFRSRMGCSFTQSFPTVTTAPINFGCPHPRQGFSVYPCLCRPDGRHYLHCEEGIIKCVFEFILNCPGCFSGPRPPPTRN